MKYVVIIPTYNERENIGKIVPEIFALIPEINVLVVDDNSPDQTQMVVRDLQQKFPNLSLLARQGKEGLGKAYLDAFWQVLKDETVDGIVMMDADFSHDPRYLPELLKNSSDFDIVVASRYLRGGETVGWELWRKFLSTFGNLYARIILRMPITDYTGGFNLIKSNALRKVDFSTIDASGYAFQIELKYLLWKMGGRFTEVPIIFKNRLHGESKISGHIIREGIFAPWKMIFKK